MEQILCGKKCSLDFKSDCRFSDFADSDDFADFALLNMGRVGWGGNLCVHRFYLALSAIINVIV